MSLWPHCARRRALIHNLTPRDLYQSQVRPPHEVIMMPMPREGHLKKLYHIFTFLKISYNSQMVFDPTPPDIDPASCPKEDWSHSVYGNKVEDIPSSNDPDYVESRGKGFIIRAYVDSNHAGNRATRRSRTRFLIYINNAPIYQYSKQQTGVETSSFGSRIYSFKTVLQVPTWTAF